MRVIFTALLALCAATSQAKPAAEYLSPGISLKQEIPTPESVLGWDVGSWHVRHDQLVRYMQVLAAASPRISISTTGYSHEQRPLLLLTITAEDNQERSESLRRDHLDSHGAQGPLVLYMGYSVHGDEASGSNAALLFAYYLAAAQDPWLDEVLKDTVILLDPSLNPDGLARFTQWANGHKSKHPVADPNNREHREPFPTGRVNHYWFDLNRDWLLLQHPESRARVAQFQRWRPHVLTDFHEQGSNQTYFFQPGVPSRQNPLTPERNLELTRALAEYHGQALDRKGQLYFSEERFDDYYYGKGSTYPDVQGSIGILFEQPSAAGHLIDTDHGLLSFELAVSNQLATSLSTLRGSWNLRHQLKRFQQSFIDAEMERGRSFGHSAWVVGDDGDPVRAGAFLDILRQHGIRYRTLGEDLRAAGYDYQAGKAWVIPAAQEKASLLQAIMETRTEFTDETFYDVSSWTLPLAFNLPYASLRRIPAMDSSPAAAAAAMPDDTGIVAWHLPWRNGHAPRYLAALLKQELPVKSLTRTVTATAADGSELSIAAGDLILPLGQMDPEQQQAARSLMQGLQADYPLNIQAVRTSLTPRGVDLGSPRLRKLNPVKPLLLVGEGISAYESGEIWHLLDTRVGLPPVMINSRQLSGLDLRDYTHLILVGGNHSQIRQESKDRISQWVNAGGILIGSKAGAAWAQQLFAGEDEAEADEEQAAESETPERRPYAEFENDQAQRVIGGSIVATELDLSHPLAFGYQRPALPVFRRGTTLLKASDNPYSTVTAYTDSPLISGFIGPERLQEMKGQPAVIAERQGAGLLVLLANNPSFRAYWYGTQRLFLNALFYGQLVGNTELE